MKKGSKHIKEKDATPEALIQRGNHALATFQPELAMRFFQRALTLTPTDTNIMDSLADVCVQLGLREEAFRLLSVSTASSPFENPYKWCYLAQLQSGLDAISSYQRGIEILDAASQSELTHDQSITVPRYRKLIAKAYCSIAELYMTDLCYEEDAEQLCEKSIMQALDTDPDSLDAHQTLASLRLSQGRPVDASAIMETVFVRVKHIKDITKARTVVDEINGAPDIIEQDDVPEPDFCITTAKFLIECAAVNHSQAEAAMELITDLLNEDDDNVELWYIMGVAAFGCVPPDMDAARYHLEHAREMLESIYHESQEAGEEFPFTEQQALVEEHLRLLGDQEVAELKAGSSTEGAMKVPVGHGSEEEEEEWSSCDEEDDVEGSGFASMEA